MNSILSTLRNMFVDKTQTESPKATEEAKVDMSLPMDEILSSKEEPKKAEPEKETSPEDNFPEPPPKRRVIQPPVIAGENAPSDTDGILIKAQPSAMMDQCKFMVNRSLLGGYSWYFQNFESAAGSALIEAVFSVDEVETALVHESTLTVTRTDKSSSDWRPLAKEIGAAIRGVLESGNPLISEAVRKSIPSEEDVLARIQEVIDQEVNPGVAGHGGHITLTKVEGNTVTIQMGGGCQGCSAADLTLKQGIHNSFRKALPTVGAIYDETDHKAGLNPYYS